MRNWSSCSTINLPAARVSGLDFPYRGDHGGRAAGKHLSDLSLQAPLTPVLHADPRLSGPNAEILRHLEQGRSGDTGQQRSREFWSHNLCRIPRSEHEVQVHTSHFLDPGPLCGIKPHHLIASVLGGLSLGNQRRSVVSRAFRLTCATNRGADILV